MGKWQKGQSGNPKGAKKSEARILIQKAIEKVGKERGKSLWQHLIEEAYVDNTVLIAVARKFAPDLKSLDASVELRDAFRLVLSNGHSPAKPAEPTSPDEEPDGRDPHGE
jgi:hypothetical protein